MIPSQTTRIVLSCCALLGATSPAEAFSAMDSSSASKPIVVASLLPDAQAQPSSRRDWIGNVGGMGMATVAATVATVSFPQGASAATSDEYLSELQTILAKLQTVPKLLEELKWDEARTVLKSPPVNKLWNLGDSQNTVLKLVKETGNVELFEIKDDLAYNLQMCDQLAYANNFIEFQPGNGKLKLKEPIEAINKAIRQLDQVIKDSQ